GAAGLAAAVCGAGAAVTVAACDAGDRADLAGLWGRLAAAGAGVSAVIHTTETGQATALTDVSLAEFAEVTAVTAGAAYLDELAGGGVEAFVLFSSVAGIWGSSGQVAYAAANAGLDALAQDRRARKLVAVSVAWGPWQGVETGGSWTGQQWRRRGLAAMAPRLAVTALEQAVVGGEAVAVVADVDWQRLASVFTAVRPSPLLTGVAEARQAMEADRLRPGPAPGRGRLAVQLAGLSAGEQVRLVLELVCQEAAAVLGHASADPVRPGVAFRDLGFDSLTAVELRDKLATVTGQRLPATLVFDYPSPRVLARWLHGQVTGTPAGAAALETRAPVVVAGDPVAVVAMGCRFPGGVQSPEDLWELVRSGSDAISAFPADRGWQTAGLPDPGQPGPSYGQQGGFLYDAGDFDAGFFGISPREALAMDPQQRLLLEVCWETFERAGIDPAAVRGSRTGVFAGTSGQDYPAVLALAGEGSDGHMVTGNAASVVSGRVSYVLGLEGPAVSVDTACSSSLVALHLACQALRAGECDLALAGGVTVMATPTSFAGFGEQGGLAADGRCKAFGAGADGTGWAEGAGVLLVERLTDARRNGHQVLAVVRGSAVNQDGASNGLTAPNGPSQQRVIRAALASAGLAPDQVDAVEAHGTGTRLGDPIEAQALIAAYGQDRPPEQPLWLGSVKSNIGHTQAAAGAAGVIKMVMAMRIGVLPPTLHAADPSPHVDWSAGTVRLLTGEQPWTHDGHPRRAGVSSFGMSGTNAHVILEQSPAGEPATGGDSAAGEDGAVGVLAGGGTGDIAPDGMVAAGTAAAAGAGGLVAGGVVPWVVSGRGATALRAQAGRLAGFARAGSGGASVTDVGSSLAAGRSAFEDRAVVLAADADGFAAGLEAVAAGEPAAGVIAGRAAEDGAGKVVFVFPGQGGQWAGMAAGLAGSCPAFTRRLAECTAALQPHVDWPVAQMLAEPNERALEAAEVVQPLLWAVMVALAEAWQAIGVIPDAVAGHSQGEIAAAVVAGELPLHEAARVIAVRSRMLGDLSGDGAMVAVAWPQTVAGQRVARHAGQVWVAAVNSPGSVVLAGQRQALADVVALAEAEGVRTRWLPVGYASHGPAVNAVAREVEQALAGITPGPGRVPFWSAVTGGPADTGGLDGRYWAANLRQQVRFEQVIRGLAGAGHGVFIEVSPHPVLVTAIEQTLEDVGKQAGVAGTLRRGEGGPVRLLTSAAEVFVLGVPVDWAAVFAGSGARRADLPTYAFQRRRYWPSVRAEAVALPVAG
ncbi:MAG TPA: beta-ketoacyl synthase N-terminal-like domain-containing protein, partial [Streptosporangiaceae bacterium]|nr:beta-ketoacyl synthase N-terminal-like domain-containing protein [Streptosporangiaceae bacterium]